MYVPQVGEILTVALPYETTRAEVMRVEGNNTVIAALNQSRPFSKFHDYRHEDWIIVRRAHGLGGTDTWRADGTVPKPAPVMAEEVEPTWKRRERKGK